MHKIWDIILVKFPFTNLTNFKLRPALIVWEYKNDFIILAISSNKLNWINYKLNNSDLKEWELLVKSYIKVNKITSIEKSIIFSNIAKLDKDIVKKVKKKFIDKILYL